MRVFIFILVLSSLAFSCKRAGPGGQVSLVAFPKHHSKPIPGSVVYIKYGTNKFPGDDPGKYDASAPAEYMAGESEPHAHFNDLNKGKYYLYAIGYDSAIAQVVKGGIPLEITEKAGEVEATVPVTEGD